jgi:arylsulfatase
MLLALLVPVFWHAVPTTAQQSTGVPGSPSATTVIDGRYLPSPPPKFGGTNDLAAKMPDKLRQMQELFLVEASKYNVFPLDNSVAQRLLAPRPSATAGRDVFTYSGVSSGLDSAAAPDIIARSYTITAEAEVPQGGGEGMIATLGGHFGGYGLYLLKGKPVKLGPPQLTEADREIMHAHIIKARD